MVDSKTVGLAVGALVATEATGITNLSGSGGDTNISMPSGDGNAPIVMPDTGGGMPSIDMPDITLPANEGPSTANLLAMMEQGNNSNVAEQVRKAYESGVETAKETTEKTKETTEDTVNNATDMSGYYDGIMGDGPIDLTRDTPVAEIGLGEGVPLVDTPKDSTGVGEMRNSLSEWEKTQTGDALQLGENLASGKGLGESLADAGDGPIGFVAENTKDNDLVEAVTPGGPSFTEAAVKDGKEKVDESLEWWEDKLS